MLDDGVDRIQATYGGNYQRLARSKAQYDLGNRFCVNQHIALHEYSPRRASLNRHLARHADAELLMSPVSCAACVTGLRGESALTPWNPRPGCP